MKPSTMPAVWLQDGNLQWREDVPVPTPGPGEALIRMRLAGVCGTDLELVKGYYPFTGVLGHEFVGQVVEAPTAPEWVGRRVVGEINISCGQCRFCRRGLERHCEQRKVLGILGHNGAFAAYLTLPVRNLHAVPDAVPDEAAVFTEPLAAALEILDQVHIRPTARVLVLGTGRLGQLIARVLRLTGAEVHGVTRRARHAERLRAHGVQPLTPEQVPQAAYQIVVEATGSPAGLEMARRAVEPTGRIVLKSTYAGAQPLNLSPLVVDEITVVGSRCGPFAPALRLMEQGLVDPRDLLEARYPLSQALDAFEHAARPGTLKVVLQGPDQDD